MTLGLSILVMLKVEFGAVSRQARIYPASPIMTHTIPEIDELYWGQQILFISSAYKDR